MSSRYGFFKNCKWVPYGDQENNAGTIKAQSPDPVGALVGQRGVRVAVVTSELGGEKIDVVEWSEIAGDYVKAIPARRNLVVEGDTPAFRVHPLFIKIFRIPPAYTL